jgi:hypothetical protein
LRVRSDRFRTFFGGDNFFHVFLLIVMAAFDDRYCAAA